MFIYQRVEQSFEQRNVHEICIDLCICYIHNAGTINHNDLGMVSIPPINMVIWGMVYESL